MSATSNRYSVPEILAALIALLQAVELEEDVPAFESVKRFDIENVDQAFKELMESKQRVCFVIPDLENFEPAVNAGKLMVTRRLPIALLISDRVMGDRQAALFGSDDTPGAYALAEGALEAVTGLILDNPGGVKCLPLTMGALSIEDIQKKLPGRAVVELDVECTGGTLTASLGISPIV